MKETIELGFPFSACFEGEDGLAAHNYTLWLSTDAVPRAEETRLREKVETGLIGKIASRDLGKDVDFLKDKTLSESLLLAEFWPIVRRLLAPGPLHRLSLERQGCVRRVLTDGP